MATSCEHSNPLVLEGTDQSLRTLSALLPENVKLHELSEENWLAFVKDFAELINFYELTDATIPNGNWDSFFPEKDELEAIISKYFDGDIQPHLALFIAFLKLLSYPQASLNEIPKRHLDFYYREVLRLSPNEFIADTVHVVYELAKNAIAELIEENTVLEAGKDVDGNLLQYETQESFVANQAQVVSLQSFYRRGKQLLFATNTQTKDGLEEAIEEGETWSAFGNDNWQNAELEFAVSGPILSLQEGQRVISLNWGFEKKLEIDGRVLASLTTEKGWTEEAVVEISGSKNNTWIIEISEDEDAIVSYDEEVHQKRLHATNPVLKIRFEDQNMYADASAIQVTEVTVGVSVFGVKHLEIENELGKQLPDKPFMPFGPRPKRNTAFSVSAPEFKNKDVKEFNLYMNWLNTPPNFDNHYAHYADAIAAEKAEFAANWGYVIMYDFVLADGSAEAEAKKESNQFLQAFPVQEDEMRKKFTVEISSPYHTGNKKVEMFSTLPQAEMVSDITNLKGGEIEVRLNESFYHHLYNDIYVSVVSKANQYFPNEDGVNEKFVLEAEDLPNEPYTPLVDSVTLDYSAEAKIIFGDDEVTGSQLQLFHLTPFGSKQVAQRESLLYHVSSNALFLGVANAKPRDVVSILFHVAEGSENPLLSSFSENDGIKWSLLLTNGDWLSLSEADIVMNTTNNFLRSGIIQFSLPKETATTHTLFEPNLVWLRAQLNRKPEAVARFIGIHAQASTAQFFDQNNNVSHLAAGLPPETIKQLAARKSSVKKVLQPYSSFGGTPTETDEDFYTRTSERLRHKDRAVTIWDYEHITLQEFPGLYKVKCLNHTKFQGNKVKELAPGHITLVVLPKIADTNLNYRLTPTVSQNLRDEILAFLTPKKILHAELNVVNPQYERVEFNFKVKFLKGFDYNFYRGLLEQELINLLAPWSSNSEAEILFNNSIYSYNVVNFIENLPYVDYIEDFLMKHQIPNVGWETRKQIQPSSSLGILTSKETHTIHEALNC